MTNKRKIIERSEPPYGDWEVTQSEYESALAAVTHTDDGPTGDDAYQLVRYCRGEIFLRDKAADALRRIRS